MVRHYELLLPAHEHGTSVCILHGQIWFLGFVPDVSERREAGPMDHVFLFGSAPLLREEAVAATDNLCVKVCGKLGPVVREARDMQVSA